jgi:putative hydrolase of the HAD superfamily
MPIRALLFDLDDTLLETHTAHQECVRICCDMVAERHPDWTPERLREAFTRSYRALEAQLEAGTLSLSSQRLFRTRSWEETLRACNLPLELGKELAQRYLTERRKRYRLYDEVPAALEGLAQQYRLVLVTNGLGDLQREKVAAVGLERWISRLVISGEVGSWKPDARIFRRALDLAETGAEEAVMIGDSLERDIAGARALGIRTVWMRRYGHLEPVDGIQPDATAQEIRSLPDTLARWGS